MVRKTSPELLKEIRLTRILPRPDPVTTKLSKYFSLAELMERGFVTQVNLPHIRLSEQDPDSLILLHKMALDRAMTERYSFDGSGEE